MESFLQYSTNQSFAKMLQINEAEKRVDTTQNSSVTELFPALAFNNNYKPTNINSFQDFLEKLDLTSSKSKLAFVTASNIVAGKNVIDRLKEMKPNFFKDKMQNAIGILKYLYDINDDKPITKVVWGYREKPAGIPKNHAGDIFVFFKDRSKIGISLKAGTTKSKEPLLNTYVNTTFKKLGKESLLKNLADDLWDKVYSKVPGAKDIANKNNYMETNIRNQVTNLYVDYFVKNQTSADELYKQMLYVHRVHTCDMINDLSLDEFKEWVINNFNLQMPGASVEVPLVLVKAVGMKADEKNDSLANIIGTVTKFKATLNRSSVQEWFIDITNATGDTAKLKMTIRSDSGVRQEKKPGQQGRLGRYLGLKLQYSGVV